MRGSDGRNGKKKRPLWAFLPFCSELPRKQARTNQKNATLLSVAGLPPPGSLDNPTPALVPAVWRCSFLRCSFSWWWCFLRLRLLRCVFAVLFAWRLCSGRKARQKIKAVCKTQPPFFVGSLFVVCNQTAHGTRQAVKNCFCNLPHEHNGKCYKPLC